MLKESHQWVALQHCLSQQSYPYFTLYICVNQPEEWWHMPDKQAACEDNGRMLAGLYQQNRLSIHVIDRSSPGKGWQGKQRGVGWARKLCMDAAAQKAKNHDIIVSIDADTYYPPRYLESLKLLFEQQKQIAAVANPYYHPLGNDGAANKAILRYELYMRLYALHMLRIKSPYAFTALGSAIAIRVAHYKKIGGISPKKSGEDFYFLQQIVKTGHLCIYNELSVYPAARFSARVHFGTGPAMIKGNRGEWQSYPFYLPQLFDNIALSQQAYQRLYHADIDLPISAFLSKKYELPFLWQKLRQNAANAQSFERACYELIDGLRLLQYCKSEQPEQYSDAENLKSNISFFRHLGYPLSEVSHIADNELFEEDNMRQLRDELFKIEQQKRKEQNTLSI